MVFDLPALFGSDRAKVFATIAALATVNGFAAIIGENIFTYGLWASVLGLGGVSAIVWFAIFSLLLIVRMPGKPVAPTKLDQVVILGMILAMLLPFSAAASISMIVGGIYLAVTSLPETRARRIALVMIALVGPLILGRLALALAAPLLLPLDAHLASFVAGLPVDGNIVTFAGGQGSLYVAIGCSSVHNMSLALLLFAVSTQLFEVPLSWRVMLIGISGALAIALVNVLRLAAMARFPSNFDYFHTGYGSTIFGYAGMLATIAVIGPGLYWAKRRL